MPDVKISELPAATAVATTDEFPTRQGATTRKSTGQQIVDLARLTPINNQAGTSYTPVVADAGKVVRGSNAAAITYTIETDATQPFIVGSSIAFRQVGAGAITLTPAGGVTLNIPTGYAARTGRLGATIMAHKIDTNAWDITGDLGT